MIVSLNFDRTRTSLRAFALRLISPAVGSFSLRFHFNARAWADLSRRADPDEGAWFFRLDDITGAPLIRSHRVTVAPNLLALHQVNPLSPLACCDAQARVTHGLATSARASALWCMRSNADR